MATTTNLGITLVESAQAQKEVTINQALTVLDALASYSVVDKDLAAPPASPATGALYIVAASPTGTWAGKATQLAYFDQIWRFIAPQNGLRVWVRDESLDYRFNGTAWAVVASGGGGGGSPITSSSAQAFAVGQNGNTNPAFNVDASTASSATGVQVKSAAAGAGVTLTAISSAANENITLSSKGSSTTTLNGGFFAIVAVTGNPAITATQASISFQTSFRGYSANTAFAFTGTPDSNLTASSEAMSFDINTAQVKTHNAGTIITQRDGRMRPSTHAFDAASTITHAVGWEVDGAPIAGTNASITNSSSIRSLGNAVGAGVSNSYGLNITANMGATNNYIASLNGAAGEVLRVRTDGQMLVLNTVTAAGTTGAQTINKPSGTVNFAAGASALVVTNALCSVNSLVFAVVRTNDATAIIKNVVPAAGSFTITLNAAATAATSVGFFIIN